MKFRGLLPLVSLFVVTSALASAGPQTRHVILVTLDGLRWQEVFRGIDESCLTEKDGGVSPSTAAWVRQTYGGDSPAASRARVMPFLWEQIGRHGQIIGNRDRGSVMRVSNDQWFSYPGYNEILTGAPDPAIRSNDAVPNKNVTVLEWLNGRRGFTGRVAAATTWQAFPAILNVGRAGFPIWSTGHKGRIDRPSSAIAEIERWMDDIPPDDGNEHWDAFAYRVALELIDSQRPRVLYVAFGETDTMAHQRHYDSYLDSAHRADRFIRTLWEKLQSLREYRGRTTLIITTDHGRGATPKDWVDHGREVPHSNETWMAVLGPDTAAIGEAESGSEILSAQVAATVAAFLGEDYNRAAPNAALPVGAVLPALTGNALPRSAK